MISPNSIYRSVGDARFPFSSSDLNPSEGAITDAVQETFLALFKAAINDELGDVFQIASIGTTLAGQPPVADIWAGPLTPQVMKQRKATFPILAVYRTGTANWTERTLDVLQLTQQWGIDYVMGPLGTAEIERVGRICHKIAILLQLVLWQRGHKSYQGGALQFGDVSNVTMAWVESHELGQAKFVNDDGSVIYYGLSAKMTTLEVDSDLNPYPPLTGATFTLGMGSPDGVLPDQIIALTTGPFLGSAFSNGFQLQGS